jgi:uncharacterized protein (DUF433 family)
MNWQRHPVPWARRERQRRLHQKFIVYDPEILGGAAVIRGTRMLADGVRRRIDAGDSFERLEREFPMIPPKASRAAYSYAKQNIPLKPRPSRPWHPT